MITIQSISRDVKVSRSSLNKRLLALYGEIPKNPNEEFRQEIIKEFKDHPITKNIGKVKPKTDLHYKEALKIIMDKGYISNKEIIEIFDGATMFMIQNAFDRHDEPLYDETKPLPYINPRNEKIIMRKQTIWLRLKPFREQCIREARHSPNKNGFIAGQGRTI